MVVFFFFFKEFNQIYVKIKFLLCEILLWLLTTGNVIVNSDNFPIPLKLFDNIRPFCWLGCPLWWQEIPHRYYSCSPGGCWDWRTTWEWQALHPDRGGVKNWSNQSEWRSSEWSNCSANQNWEFEAPD